MAALADADMTNFELLKRCRSWSYQLQGLQLGAAAASPFDMLVIDAQADDGTAFTAAQVARLQRKPDGSRRLVLAYLSIGEAENYRDYWKPEWNHAADRPQWIVAENRDWPGNFSVRYWFAEWKAVLWGRPTACLDRIIAAGFDGVYLDKADVWQDLLSRRRLVSRTEAALQRDMVTLISSLAQYARLKKPDFLVVMQNAEELLRSLSLRIALSGAAKEELLYRATHGNNALPVPKFEVETTVELYRPMAVQGKPVFQVEYLPNGSTVAVEKIKAARAFARQHGFVLHIANVDRALADLGAVP